MSLQQLLPEDVLVRVLSIALDDEKVPSRHRVNRGTVKEQNAKRIRAMPPHIQYLLNETEKFYAEEKELNRAEVKESKVEQHSLDTVKVPIVKDPLNCNLRAYNLISEIFSDIDRGYKFTKGRYQFHMRMMTEALKFSMVRLGKGVPEIFKARISEKHSSGITDRAKYMSAATHLENIRDEFNTAQSAYVKLCQRNGMMDDEIGTIENHYRGNEKVIYIQVGKLSYIAYKTSRGVYRDYAMTTTHFSRIIDQLKFYARLRSVITNVSHIDSASTTLKNLRDIAISISLKCPNTAGGVIKAARQILFLRGDKSSVMGQTASRTYIDGLDGDKERYSEKTADDLQAMFHSRIDALNISNYFKSVFHPDSHMSELFDTITNLRVPNSPNETMLVRFNGTLRRATYDSLIKQRKDVRLKAIDREDKVSTDFVRSVNSSSREFSAHLSAGFTQWNSTEFKAVVGIYEQSIGGVSISNKSSSRNFTVDEKKFDDLNSDLKFADEMRLRDGIKTVNDIQSVMDGTSELDFDRARERFMSVKHLHEQFERRSGCNKIEDIPWESLQAFVLDCPAAAYVVLTEPKLGEVHKKVSRLFYMAEQALKVMTQTAERIAKQISGKHAGVSITKGYQGRRREIEEMAHAFTGYTGGDGPIPDTLYISFDMSEFSKRFPMDLVRIYGKMASEISGQEWLSRPDLFFRSSIVLHKSRGYHAAMAGVKGGFEGFLNFMWSAIMATVMEIAKEVCGVDGVLCAYSDDGVLRIYVKGTKEEQAKKLMKLQTAFRRHGLAFHFSKTAASYEVMEYLGEYVDEGRILSTWIKELCSLGLRKSDSGLEFITDKITRLSAQANAVISAKGPAVEIATLMYYLVAIEIERKNSNYPEDYYYLMQLIPYGMGGCRTPSVTELSTISRIESHKEVIADWKLFADLYPYAINSIIVNLNDTAKTGQEAAYALLGGSLFQTFLPDTSCSDIVRNMLEKGSSNTAMLPDPLKPAVRNFIVGNLLNAVNLKPKVIMNLIASIPSVIEYNKAIAITKSSAVLKFYKRSDIAKAQSKGNRRAIRSIRSWCEMFRFKRELDHKVDVERQVNRYLTSSFANYSIDLGPDSARIALSVSDDDSKADIKTAVEFTADDYLRSQPFFEPVKKFITQQFTAEYKTEGSVDSEERRIKRFANYGARLVAENPSNLYIYYLVANAFELPVPAPPTGFVQKDMKSVRTSSNVAVASMIESPFDALTTSQITHKLYDEVKEICSVDRTTYAEIARLFTSIIANAQVPLDRPVGRGVTIVRYNIDNVLSNMENKTFILRYEPDFSKIDGKITKSFTSILIEQENRNRQIDSLIQSRNIANIRVPSQVTNALLLKNFTQWLYSATRTISYSGFAPRSDYLPIASKGQIMMEASIDVAMKLSEPIVRSAINRSMSSFLDLCSNKCLATIMSSNDCCRSFESCLEACLEQIIQFEVNLDKVFNALSCLDLSNGVASRFQTPSVSAAEVRPYFIQYLMRKAVVSPHYVPSTVVTTSQFADSSMSPGLKSKIRDVIDVNTGKLFDAITDEKYESKSLYEDHVINELIIIRSMLRTSGHRDLPFNATMSALELIKFNCFLERRIHFGNGPVEIDELNDYRVPVDLANKLIENNVLLRPDESGIRGRDYRDCLFNKGILPALFPRARYIYSRLNERFVRTMDNYYLTLINTRLLLDARLKLLQTYDIFIKKIVSKIEIFNASQAYDITRLSLVTPVEEARNFDAIVWDDIVSGFPHNLPDAKVPQSIKTLMVGLVAMHSARWGIDTYDTSGADFLHFNLGLRGLVSRNGVALNSYYETRDHKTNGTVMPDFKEGLRVIMHEYQTVEAAVNSYLVINKREMCMAVVCQDGNSYYVLGVITPEVPLFVGIDKGTPSIMNEVYEDFPVFDATSLNNDIVMMINSISMSEGVAQRRAQAEFVSISRAFHRESKIIRHIEESDEFLVAIGEVCRFGWSLNNARRVYIMVAAWMMYGSDIEKRHLRAVKRKLHEFERISTEDKKVELIRDMSLVWQWVKSKSIGAGINIDSAKVAKMVNSVGRTTDDGGCYVTMTAMPQKSVEEVKFISGTVQPEDMICRVSNYLYRSNLLFKAHDADDFYDDESDSDDGW